MVSNCFPTRHEKDKTHQQSKKLTRFYLYTPRTNPHPVYFFKGYTKKHILDIYYTETINKLEKKIIKNTRKYHNKNVSNNVLFY